ncbi:MAG: TRAP transporter large permease subunit [Campylobacterales bacterium]|nr:TRAP transporter large permease subunit [Campylobacterales bacterium]
MDRVSRFLGAISQNIGKLSAVLVIILALLVFYDTIMRYLFNAGSIALQELEWHIFDVLFLLGIAYALRSDAHVRVDIFFDRYSDNTKATIKLLSMLFLVIPSSVLIAIGGWDMAVQSMLQNEISSDPGGLTHRFIIKSFVAIAFAFVIIEAFHQILLSFAKLTSKKLLFKYLAFIASMAGVAMIDMEYLVEPVAIMFLLSLAMLLAGFEVAFVFAGVGMLFAAMTDDIGLGIFDMLSYRIYGIMQNVTLMAVPLFILMGLILQKTRMAEDLLLAVAKLFGKVRGGLAIGVILVGAMLGASTGIVGATVVMMSLIALPLMLKHRYSPSLASGAIASSGTLGQIIPPSVVLIILGDQMHLSVGDLFRAAIVPSMILIGLYIAYILITAWLKPDIAPAIKDESSVSMGEVIQSILPPIFLMVAVLGSIFSGIATPTESAAIGVMGALLIALFKKELNFDTLKYASLESVKLTSMIFMILIGATIFSLVFNELGGGDLALEFFAQDLDSKAMFVAIAMLVIFLLGFFIDFIEIAFVVVPILLPIVNSFGIDPIWFAILVALNLQASFLTPPFGFTLFYLKGSAKELVKTQEIYRGVIPYIVLQIVAIGIVIAFPSLIYLW